MPGDGNRYPANNPFVKPITITGHSQLQTTMDEADSRLVFSFKWIMVLNRILYPIAFLAIFIILESVENLPIGIGCTIPFALLLILGSITKSKAQNSFIEMKCPICNRRGIAGCGVTTAVGWWFRCSECGLVWPTGLLGLKYRIQFVDDAADCDEPDD